MDILGLYAVLTQKQCFFAILPLRMPIDIDMGLILIVGVDRLLALVWPV